MTKNTPLDLAEALRKPSISKATNALADSSETIQQLLDEPEYILQLTASPSVKFEMLHVVRDSLAAIVAPVSACGKGCSHCCKMAVAISSHDAEVIGEFIGIKPLPVETNMDQRGLIDKYMGCPCPFLKKGICSIYEVRPTACRTHFNISEYPEVCDVINFPGHDVPNLNFQPLWMAEGLLALTSGGTLADIREFFPYGKDAPDTL